MAWRHSTPRHADAATPNPQNRAIFPAVNETISQKLRQLRVETGLNQEQFAARIGMTQSGISKIENGSRMPSRQTISAWAEACGKTMEIAGLPELSEGERALLDATASVEPDDLFLLAEATRGLAVVKGADRAMARQLLQGLAERAPATVADKERDLSPVAPETAARVRK